MLLLMILLLAFVVYHYGINRILGLPPGPPPLPLVGNMLSFQWDIDKVLLQWKEQYGRIFTVWLPFPVVVIGDHKILQEHIVRNGDVFLAKKNPEQLMNITSNGQFGLVFEENDMVKEQRKFALKTFHEIGFGSNALEDSVYHYSLEIVSRWKKSGDKEVDVTENIMRAVGNIVWKIIFGITLEFENELLVKFRAMFQEAHMLMGGPLMMFIETFPSLQKLDFLFGSKIEKLHKLSVESLDYMREAIKTTELTFNLDNQPSCYIEAFLTEQARKQEHEQPIGNYHYEQMLQSAHWLWGAGFDTTVSVLRMCIMELINYQKVQRKLQKELDDVIGERRIRFADHKQLPYMCAFLQEIYRVGNVLPLIFMRQTTQDTVIDGHRIAAGTTILPQFPMVHADPKEFERPDYFCPERHLNEEGHFVKDPRITPFSLGKRSCLGESLARMQVFVIFSTFVQNCNFTSVGKVPPAIEFKSGLTKAVVHFQVKIQSRNWVF